MPTVSLQTDTSEQLIQNRWQQQMRDGLSDPRKLLQLLQLQDQAHLLSAAAAQSFRQRVPLAFVARMRPGDIHDPLLRQVLPLVDEELQVDGFSDDPVADLEHIAVPGLIHKYHGRVLLIVTGACAVNCRYCFRRAFPYSEQSISSKHFQQSLAYIERDNSISEVILSGGDPLTLATQKLRALTTALTAIEHVRRIRIHTRVPVVLPDRVDAALCRWLSDCPCPVAMVLHCNHANELDQHLQGACSRLRDSGVSLLNQAVLLRGINDSAAAQIELSERLFAAGVLPYYLHQLDPVTGASHFQVSDDRAQRIYQQMRDQLPGYLLPRLVRDVPGESAKTRLSGC